VKGKGADKLKFVNFKEGLIMSYVSKYLKDDHKEWPTVQPVIF